MMPRTHFLIGVCVGLVINLFIPLSFWHVFLAGFIAVIIDLDHLINFWRIRHDLSVRKAWNTAFKHLGFERSFLHRRYGILFFAVLSIFLGFFSHKLGVVVFCAALSHWIFDHAHFKKLHERFIEVHHWLYPISREELALDLVFVLMISLLLVPLIV